MSKYIDTEKLIAKLREHLIIPTVHDRDYDNWEMGKDAGLQQAIDIVESLQQEQAIEGKQVIIITETDGDANIQWDCCSLDDVMALLKSAESFIDEKQIEKIAGPGSGPDYATTEGRYSYLFKRRQERMEENKLPDKRARVNYAICKLQSFKPLREAVVLDDYVYDEGKCYRENLLNYIHAIPENRLTEIRSYLKEKGWWSYDDDADWGKQEQPEVDLDDDFVFDEIMSVYDSNNCFPPRDKESLEMLEKVFHHAFNIGYNTNK